MLGKLVMIGILLMNVSIKNSSSFSVVAHINLTFTFLGLPLSPILSKTPLSNNKNSFS